MKESTHNLTLIARGACLGYVTCFCLGLVVFGVFGLPIFDIDNESGLVELIEHSAFFGFYGMGLGIATELTLASKSFREKLALYIVGISLSPPIIFMPLLHLFSILENINGYIFYFLLLSISLSSVIACLYHKRASRVEFITYLAGYASVFLAFATSGVLLAVAKTKALSEGEIFTLMFAIISLIFSITSVSLTKLFFSRIKKV